MTPRWGLAAAASTTCERLPRRRVRSQVRSACRSRLIELQLRTRMALHRHPRHLPGVDSAATPSARTRARRRVRRREQPRRVVRVDLAGPDGAPTRRVCVADLPAFGALKRHRRAYASPCQFKRRSSLTRLTVARQRRGALLAEWVVATAGAVALWFPVGSSPSPKGPINAAWSRLVLGSALS
jgi:hypothetical protein